MSAWDLTCRPPATGTTATNEQLTTRSTQQVGRQHHNDRLAKLRLQQEQQQQQQVIPFALTGPAAPLVWATNSSAATTSEQLQALITTATSNTTTIGLDHTPTRGYLCTGPAASLSQHVAWLEALRKQQDLARQCSVMVAAAAPNVILATQQHSLGSTMLLNSQCNSGQSSTSSSPGGSRQSTTSSSPVESVDLTLTRRSIAPKHANANKPQRSPSMSLSSSSFSSSSSDSTSRANSFDGDYTLASTPTIPNSSGSGAGDAEPLAGCRVDRRARKKDQNRRAAYNYRRKKMEERDRMIEEEARLVHKHVRLAGKIARLEEKILTILSTKTRKVSDTNGFLVCHICPVCMKSCVNIPTLRNHIKTQHHEQKPVPNNNTAGTRNEMSLWATPLGHTMSATNESLDDMDDDDDEVDSRTHKGTRDTPNRDRGIRCTLPDGDMTDCNDDDDNDSSTF